MLTDKKVIIKNYAKKVASKYLLNSNTPRQIPDKVLIRFLTELIKSLIKIPSLFKKKIDILKSYQNPNRLQKFNLYFIINYICLRDCLPSINCDETILALRLAISNSLEAELQQLIEACKGD